MKLVRLDCCERVYTLSYHMQIYNTTLGLDIVCQLDDGTNICGFCDKWKSRFVKEPYIMIQPQLLGESHTMTDELYIINKCTIESMHWNSFRSERYFIHPTHVCVNGTINIFGSYPLIMYIVIIFLSMVAWMLTVLVYSLQYSRIKFKKYFQWIGHNILW